MFVPPDECTDVAGQISRSGWCKIFARKEAGDEIAMAGSPKAKTLAVQAGCATLCQQL